ncbi:MAG: hypothetical protein V1860_04270 [bacterium]
MRKILYLWDLGGTLFPEKWNSEKTGFQTYEDWAADKLGKAKEELSNKEIDWTYEIPYKEGWHINLELAKGFKEVLEWAKNNEAFTSGIPEQIEWRAEYLNPRVGFDVRAFLKKINAASDYGAYNTKTKEMFLKYLNERYKQGYKIVVFTDDNLKYCDLFKQAADEQKDKHQDFSYRCYHILNDNGGLRKKEWYFEIGNLYDLMKNEKCIIG